MSEQKQLPPKTSWFWVKNTKGKPDAVLTLMLISFMIVTGSYLASILGSVTIGALSMTFNAFDVAYATAITVPLMATYFGRRWTDANAKNEDSGYHQ